MSEKDHVFMMFELCKIAIAVLSAADIPLIAWIALNHANSATSLVTLAVVVALVLCGVIMAIIVKAVGYARRARAL